MALLPIGIAFGRRHHQRFAIAALAALPLLAVVALAGALFTLVASAAPGSEAPDLAQSGIAGGIILVMLGPAVLSGGGLCWFVALIWSLTAVQYVPRTQPPAAEDMRSVSQDAIERRRAERRARGY